MDQTQTTQTAAVQAQAVAAPQSIPGQVPAANPAGDVANPAISGNSGSNIDLQALQAVTQQALATRPEQPTPFTKGANPAAAAHTQAAQPQPQQDAPASQLAANEDPLQKLMQLVGEKKQGSPEELPKKLFVVVKGKIANELLDMLIVSLLQKGFNPVEVLRIVLNLDKQVEEGRIDNSTFSQLIK